MTADYIRAKKPQLIAAIFDNPNHVWHKYGPDTPEYYTTRTELDNYVARIAQITKDAGIFDDTVFIVTSDHGGINKGHRCRIPAGTGDAVRDFRQKHFALR